MTDSSLKRERSALADPHPIQTNDTLASLARSIDRQSELGRRRTLVSRSVVGPFVVTDDGERLLNFGGNDYMGVVADRLAQTLAGCVTSNGTLSGGASSSGDGDAHPPGATASASVCGWSPSHQRLSEAIANLEQADAAVVFPSGYAACSGAVATLCQAGDLILSDELNHASLIDGCRLSRATKIIFPHRDVNFVRRVLSQRRGEFQNVWIVTDGVFSMDGDVAPLAELADISEQYSAHVLVDEAHGTGVLGDRGGGLCEAMGLQQRIPIRIGTLSKAVGHQGGFVVGPRVVVDYLVQFCRTLIYSTALPPATAFSATGVIDSLPSLRDRREKVAHLASRLRDLLKIPGQGIERIIPIVPVILGGDQAAIDASEQLRRKGFFVPAIRPPTVPEGTARLRVSITAAHDEDHIDRLAAAIASSRQLHANEVT